MTSKEYYERSVMWSKCEWQGIKCHSCQVPRLECVDWGSWSEKGWLCKTCNRCTHCDKRHGTIHLLNDEFLCRQCDLQLREELDDFTSL